MARIAKNPQSEQNKEEKDILKTVSVKIPQKIYDDVLKIAIEEGRETFSNQCRYFLKKAVDTYKKENK